MYFKMAHFPLLLKEAVVIFILYLLWGPHQAPRGKSHNLVGVPMNRCPWSFYLLELSTLSLQNSSLSGIVSLPQPWFQRWFMPLSLCSDRHHSSYWPVCLSIVGGRHLSCVLPSLTYSSKKRC